MSKDLWEGSNYLDAPAYEGFSITPSDDSADDFDIYTRGIYIGVDGDVVVVTSSGTALTFKGLLAGTILPVRAKRINSTNTTATDLIGLY